MADRKSCILGKHASGRTFFSICSAGFRHSGLIASLALTWPLIKLIIRAFALRKLRTDRCSSNGGNVIKLDIVNQVADKTGVPKAKAEVAVEALFEAMKIALQRGERIELRGFGVFVVKPRKRGVGRNPRTGQVTNIPPGKTIRFKPGKELQS